MVKVPVDIGNGVVVTVPIDTIKIESDDRILIDFGPNGTLSVRTTADGTPLLTMSQDDQALPAIYENRDTRVLYVLETEVLYDDMPVALYHDEKKYYTRQTIELALHTWLGVMYPSIQFTISLESHPVSHLSCERIYQCIQVTCAESDVAHSELDAQMWEHVWIKGTEHRTWKVAWEVGTASSISETADFFPRMTS